MAIPHFAVEVERLDRPALVGRAVVVGGALEERRQVVDCSPEAMARGVRVGMALREALSRCPEATFVEARPERYRMVTQRVVEAMLTISPLVEVAEPGVFYVGIPPTRPRSVGKASPGPSGESGQRTGSEGEASRAGGVRRGGRPGGEAGPEEPGVKEFEVEVGRAIQASAEQASGLRVRVGIGDGKFAAYVAAVAGQKP